LESFDDVLPRKIPQIELFRFSGVIDCEEEEGEEEEVLGTVPVEIGEELDAEEETTLVLVLVVEVVVEVEVELVMEEEELLVDDDDDDDEGTTASAITIPDVCFPPEELSFPVEAGMGIAGLIEEMVVAVPISRPTVVIGAR